MSEKELAREPRPKNALLDRIAVHHSRFLHFLAKRVEDAATAEDILQSAYVKLLEAGTQIREEESTVAWFYRVLRNAVIDHFRRRTTMEKAHEGFAMEAPASYEPELKQMVCACIGDVVQNLKAEYRTAIEQVDLGGKPVEEFARFEQISATNASVRLHRARKTVAKHLTTICGTCAEHKCLDCTCRHSHV